MGIDEKVKLYIRLPVKIEEESDVKNLHPDILAVHLPRQKSRRWCFVDLQDQESLERVSKDLRKKKINGKKLVVCPYKKRKSDKKLLEGVPEENLVEIVKQLNK